MASTSTISNETALRNVLDRWKAHVDAHEPERVRRLADDLVLGYLRVGFGFTDRPTLRARVEPLTR